MTCFLAPMAAGIITTAFRKKVPVLLKINWLNMMLWGGVVMLLVDHIANGELVFYPPFLTAIQNSTEIPVMLQELTILGGLMTIAIVFVWIILITITSRTPRKSKQVE